MNSIDAVLSGEYFEDAFYVLAGEKCVQQGNGPTQSNETPPVFAPDNPINGTALINQHLTDFTVFGTYPNPVYDDVTIQLFLANKEGLTLECYDVAGKLVFKQKIEALNKGLNYVKL